MSTNSACSADGNGDLYGLGIRVGFYAQWTSTLLAKFFLPEEIPAHRTVNLLLQFAVIVCLVFMSARKTIHPPEVMIAFWLLVGSPSSLRWGFVQRNGIVARLFRVALYAALSMPCENLVFLGGTTTNGWFRWLGKAGCIIGLAACVGVFVWIAVDHRKRGGYEEAATNDEKGQKSNNQERPQVDVALLAVSVLVMALSIVSTEYLIIDNRLDGVNDILEPGQLIPLIVGTFGLLGIVSSMFEGQLLRPQCLTLMGYHFT
ncbi:hypothetical protein B0T18DRAFT_410247 [Schizothecium vesticola]|uniref:Uncharacterized protein n=1 Tax=Schizothecium vesticola TaxID=314040 RepID=A0AA40K4Q2_9PEZI|nr:hypothetical protein B0T18DRAFT_410247 [Schizothecium vesticola]